MGGCLRIQSDNVQDFAPGKNPSFLENDVVDGLRQVLASLSLQCTFAREERCEPALSALSIHSLRVNNSSSRSHRFAMAEIILVNFELSH